MSEQPEKSESAASDLMDKMPKKVVKPLAAGAIAAGLTFAEMKYRGLKGNILIDPPNIPLINNLPFKGGQVKAFAFTGMMVFLGSTVGDALAGMMLPLEPENSMKSRYISLASVTATTLGMHYLISKNSVGARNPLLLMALVAASEFAGNMTYDFTVGSKFGQDVDYDFYYDDFY